MYILNVSNIYYLKYIYNILNNYLKKGFGNLNQLTESFKLSK